MRLLSLLFLMAQMGRAVAGVVCGAEEPCTVEDGIYLVSPPSGWNGRDPLPTVVFYHGYGDTAAKMLNNRSLRQAFDKLGILLVLPQADGKAWGHQGRRFRRDDFAYTEAVLADVRKRFPIDEAHLFAAGFSDGGSMVWDLACRARFFKAYVALSGPFWDPLPPYCPAAPFDLLHFHGLSDNVVPLEGQRYNKDEMIEGLFRSFAIITDANGCKPPPDTFATVGDWVVRSWTRCQSGRRLDMVLHKGGHEMPAGWADFAWQWVQDRAREAAARPAPP